MNKTDRLLAIVLELQRKGNLRAVDLAATFETSVRTIYRDIQALSEAGVPIIGSPGLGYSLMEGYFLPPVSFTVEEAVTLLIGTDFVEQKFDKNFSSKAKASRRKIEVILPESVHREAAQVRTSIKLLDTATENKNSGVEKEFIETLRQAILEEQKVRFHYFKKIPEADGNRHGVRVVDPYGLVLTYGSWVLIARCNLRQELRHFRLSRMSELTILEHRFTYPSDFNLQDYKPLDDRSMRVLILANLNIADKIKESNNFYLESMEDYPHGLLVSFRVRQPEDVLSWVLSWGADVVVLEPESLRKRVRDEAEKMLKHY